MIHQWICDLCFIANRLSKIPRFDFGPFISLAQHAVHVSLYEEIIGADLSLQWWALHHEDAEAYSPESQSHSQFLLRIIARGLDCRPLWPAPLSVTFLDKAIVAATEAQALIPENPGSDPMYVANVPPDERIPVDPLPPHRARALWIDRLKELQTKMEFGH